MDTQAKKQQIAASFQKHFYQFGFKKTSVDDIAHELSISKKTIYQLFPSKEAIYDYLLQAVAGNYQALMQKKLEPFPDAEKKLQGLVKLFLEESKRWSKPVEDFDLQHRYTLAREAFNRAFVSVLKQIIERGVLAQTFIPAPAEISAEFAAAVARTALELSGRGENPAVEDLAQQAVVKMLR